MNGVLSGPAKHVLQAILHQVHGTILRLATQFFQFYEFSWLRRFT